MIITERNEHPLLRANPALLNALKKKESELFIEFLIEREQREYRKVTSISSYESVTIPNTLPLQQGLP